MLTPALNKEILEAYKRRLLDQLDFVEGMLENFNELGGMTDDTSEHRGSPVAPLRSVSNISQKSRVNRPPRVRGVLAAVKDILENLPGLFDKNDIMAKLKDKDPKLAAKLSPANLRNTLRSLAKSGYIEVQIDATSTRCAKYVKRVAA